MVLAATLPDQVALKKISEDHYVTLFNPDKMGNAANIAYGGCTVGVGVNAAYQTIKPGYHCYSIMGNYLGPALTDRKLFCKVRRYRDTRTFASRQVEVSQEQDDGTHRPCLILLAEFQVQEPGTLFDYSAPPASKYAPAEDSPTRDEVTSALVKEGKVSQKMVDVFNIVFGLMARFWESRSPPGTVMSEKLYGMAKHLKTTQDHLPITSKTSAEWVRSKSKLSTEAENISALSFYMDGALSFIPLSYSNLFLQDAAACSTLDFALRLFSNKVDMNQWHIKEMKTINGGEGRTYNEAQIWDQQGNMIASMTQQCIMRPHKPKPVKAAL
ncbi:Thioesterase/thiol ester dehydrase-isomerase [Lophium mytilinum]|uniref:Thioesterase/thiol ester dehydrase-isomerase n=1 Tax=Lophium mytilinum TaxID=390894 RepID=A0A6A6RHD2_9PEZI|nr:Thioesterase/thiol ester dehydrase-isomerase [Lophium mytilinum]